MRWSRLKRVTSQDTFIEDTQDTKVRPHRGNDMSEVYEQNFLPSQDSSPISETQQS